MPDQLRSLPKPETPGIRKIEAEKMSPAPGQDAKKHKKTSGPGPAGKVPNRAPPGLSARRRAQKNAGKKPVMVPGLDSFSLGPSSPAEIRKKI